MRGALRAAKWTALAPSRLLRYHRIRSSVGRTCWSTSATALCTARVRTTAQRTPSPMSYRSCFPIPLYLMKLTTTGTGKTLVFAVISCILPPASSVVHATFQQSRCWISAVDWRLPSNARTLHCWPLPPMWHCCITTLTAGRISRRFRLKKWIGQAPCWVAGRQTSCS